MEHYVIKPAGEAGEAAVHAGLRAYNRTFEKFSWQKLRRNY